MDSLTICPSISLAKKGSGEENLPGGHHTWRVISCWLSVRDLLDLDDRRSELSVSGSVSLDTRPPGSGARLVPGFRDRFASLVWLSSGSRGRPQLVGQESPRGSVFGSHCPVWPCVAHYWRPPHYRPNRSTATATTARHCQVAAGPKISKHRPSSTDSSGSSGSWCTGNPSGCPSSSPLVHPGYRSRADASYFYRSEPSSRS